MTVITEQAYYALWCETVDTSAKPAKQAIQGGEIATEPAQMFVAGYQAAIRQTFPQLKSSGWISYAASEDRSEQPKPGVTIEDQKLYGYKTWIATSEQVDLLVIKVGTGETAQYVTTDTNQQGVTITSKPKARFLTNMSQGEAHFDGATYKPIENTSRVAQFKFNEPYYIYLAFIAYLQRNVSALRTQAASLIEIHAEDIKGLSVLDTEVQKLNNKLENLNIEIGDNWASDKRLFSMYSSTIQAGF